MIGIYKIENKITHQKYIGQSIDIKQRWKNHKAPSTWNSSEKNTYNYKLYQAIRQYGINNFEFSIIEECSKEELNDKEIYWISYYNSYKNGYNMTLGGSNTSESKRKIYQYDRFGNYVQEFTNIRTAAETLNISSDSIYCAICDKTLGGGYQWSYEKLNSMPFYISHQIPVSAFDLNGNKIKDYNSIKEASIQTGDGIIAIASSCESQKYNYTKYQWRYAQDFHSIQNINISFNNSPKAISQYTLDGQLIKHYNNINEALIALNLKKENNGTNLIMCLKKQQKSFQGYLWTYYGEPAPEPYIDNRIGHKTSSSKRIIQQYSKQNEFIKEYESAHEAARQINKSSCANHITECCQGKRKTCQGYIWKYKEN